MKLYCDLHTHSIFSDGTDTPEQLIARAERLGLSALALTDHNSVAGLPRFLKAAERSNVTAVPGIEFSTGYENGELHILALFVRPEHYSAINDLVALPRKRKRESNQALAEKLTRAGYAIDYAQLEASTPGGHVNRAHFAAELKRKGFVSSMDEAFRELLKPGGAFYQPPKRLDALETIEFIRSIGAVAVLAHPFLNLDREGVEGFLTLAVPRGLDGMEVLYSKFDEKTTEMALGIAEKYGLCKSGGSDYHGNNKPDIALGSGKGELAVPHGYYETLAALAAERQGG